MTVLSRSVVTYCDKAIAPHCAGHSAFTKWPDCVSEECWFYPDDQTGDCGTVGWYVALILQHTDETTANGILVKAGTYLTIRETDAGHVYVQTHESAQAAQDEFDEWESLYGDYLSGQEAYEARVAQHYNACGRGI